MTRDSPSTTDYAYKVIGSIKGIFKYLPLELSYKSLFKKYCEYILNHRSAIHHATELLPILVAVVVIQVERDLSHAHELTEIRNQYNSELKNIREEMDQLRREIKSLTSNE
jgi:hypothetical protein